MKNIFIKGLTLSLICFYALIWYASAYTGWVVEDVWDYVDISADIGDGQYGSFMELVNSPIGYLLMFVLGLGLLKWMWFEIKTMTPKKK